MTTRVSHKNCDAYVDFGDEPQKKQGWMMTLQQIIDNALNKGLWFEKKNGTRV